MHHCGTGRMVFRKHDKQALSLQPSAENASLFALWQRARDGQGQVQRESLGLRELSAFHEKLFIMERLGEDGFRLRLAGGQINRVFGMNMWGRDLREKASDFEAIVLGRLFNLCLDEAEPILARMRLLRRSKEPLVAELLGLPLVGRYNHRQILGALHIIQNCDENFGKFDSISAIQLTATRILTCELPNNLLFFPFAKEYFAQNSMNSDEFANTR